MAKPVSVRSTQPFNAGQLVLPRKQAFQLPAVESPGGFYLRCQTDLWIGTGPNVDPDTGFWIPDDEAMPVNAHNLSDIWVWVDLLNKTLWWTTK